MSARIQALRERRRTVLAEAERAIQPAAAEGRHLSHDEQRIYEHATAEVDDIDAELERLVGQEQRDAQARTSWDAAFGGATQRPSGFAAATRSDNDLMDSFREAVLENSPKPIVVRNESPRSYYQPGIERRDLVTTSPANMMGVSFYNRIIENMVEASSVLAAGATLVQTDSGEPLRVPRQTALGTAGIVTEGSAIPESDPTLGLVTLGAYKYGLLVQVSTEMVQDSGVDLPGYLARETGTAIGLALGNHLINGTGTGQPTGVLTGATQGVAGPTGTATTFGAQGTAGQGTDLINALFGSVIEPYTRGPGVAWLMRSSTLGNVRSLKAATSGELVGNVILTPTNTRAAAADLLGKPVFVDGSVPSPIASAKSVIFGDFSRYFVRMVNGIRFERSDDFAFDRDLVTFRCLLRADGALVDTTGAIKYFQQSSS